MALATVCVAAVPTMWLMGSSGLRHLGVRSPFTDWSWHLLPSYGFVGAIIGSAAFALMFVGVVRVAKVLRLHRRLSDSPSPTGETDVEILAAPGVFAYTLPGPSGTIVVSEGLVAALDAAEYRAVVEHERAHSQHRHDRYLLLGRLATALVPFVRPLADRLEFSLERWADDVAADRVGDRRLVAMAIAKVALAGAHPSAGVPGIAKLGAAARAEALLDSVRAPGITHPAMFLSGGALVTAVLTAAVQLHRTAHFGATLLG